MGVMPPVTRRSRIGRTTGSLLAAMLAVAVMMPGASAASPAMAGKWDVGSFGADGSFGVEHAAPLPHRGAAFRFLDRPDTIFLVTSNAAYRGLLLGDLAGKTLSARMGVDVSPGTQFEYFGEPDGSGVGATVRLYFETNESLGAITCPCQDKGNASFWYSSPVFVELDALVAGDVTLAASLEPSMWADAQERPGDADAEQAALFDQAVRDVGFVGFSFGGGRHFHNGVGITAGTGSGSFKVLGYDAN